MKKLLLSFILVLLPFAASADVNINETNFPDDAFRNYLIDTYGNVITDNEIEGITFLVLSGLGIKDMKGIEFFTAIEGLYCEENQLTSLDVTSNTALIYLGCNNNQLTSLSTNSNLKSLYCYNNQLTALDLSKSPNLSVLECYNNQLTSLDLSKNTNLTNLSCYDNQLTSLIVSGCNKLKSISCYNNKLASLDVKNNEALTGLRCAKNLLTELDVSKNANLGLLYCNDNQLTALDLSNNTKINELACYGNQIRGKAMDNLVAGIRSKSGFDRTPILYLFHDGNVCTKVQVETLREKGWNVYCYVGNNDQWVNFDQYKALDWEDYVGYDPDATGIQVDEVNFPDIAFRRYVRSISYSTGYVLTDDQIKEQTYFNLYDDYSYHKDIESLKGIEIFTNLSELRCGGCKLTDLDVSKNTKLTGLRCSSNHLTSLNVSGCTKLQRLEAGFNQLTTLDLSNNNSLVVLDVMSNLLTSLNLSDKEELSELYCQNNKIVALLPSLSPKLTLLACQNNLLTELDLKANEFLKGLNCGDNQLTNLNVTKNTSLTTLGCYNNKLTSLDVTENTLLETFDCSKNQLTSLNVVKNTLLQKLYCYDNLLTSLDLSSNTNLYHLNCFKNNIVGENMDNLIASLNDNPIPNFGDDAGVFRVIQLPDNSNVCTSEQVAAAAERGWTAYFTDSKDEDGIEQWTKYAPSFPTESGGAGTQENPYLIKTVEDLKKLATDTKGGLKYQKRYFVMDNDIDFVDEPQNGSQSGINFSSIGYFGGFFDGKGYTIKNMKAQALFNTIRGAELKNIIFDKTCEFNVASVVSSCYGGNVIGCVNYANVNGSGSTGGIIGQIYMYDDTNITNCKNYGIVTGSYGTGGIIGTINDYGDVMITISQCLNEGKVSGSAIGTGGIVGGTNRAIISNCTNRGEVEGGTAMLGNHIDKTGGIAGSIGIGTISDCINEGVIKGPSSVGGIVGQNDGIIERCINAETGIVYGNGGIVGLNYGAVRNCRNMGNITSTGTAGAIVGFGSYDNLKDNFYTENVVISYNNNLSYNGAISRGFDGHDDIVENNGAVLESVTIDAEKQGDEYWTTFYRQYGHFQADENTTVYTAKLVTESKQHKLLLTVVPDRIIKDHNGVILKSTQNKIKLTYTSEAATDSYYEGNSLEGTDSPINSDVYNTYHMLVTGEELGFKKYTQDNLPANNAFIRNISDEIVLLELNGKKLYYVEPGDLNEDDIVNLKDRRLMVNAIMTGSNDGINEKAADINNDTKVNVADVVLIVKKVNKLVQKEEAGYYLIGDHNSWSTTDKSYAFSYNKRKKYWEITVSSENMAFFKIVPESAYADQDTFWSNLLCAETDWCTSPKGTIVKGDFGAWLLNADGATSYTIRIVPAEVSYEIIAN